MVGGLIAVEYLVNLINISAAAFFAARYSGDIEIKVGEFDVYREGGRGHANCEVRENLSTLQGGPSALRSGLG